MKVETKKRPQTKQWLLTLLDLMMLMLSFFIMLYAVRTPEGSLFSKIPYKSPISLKENLIFKRGVHLNYLEQILKQKIDFSKSWKIYQQNAMLTIEIPLSAFENIQKRFMINEAENKLIILGEVLNNISNEIVLLTSSYEDNILLSAQIANILKKGGLINQPPLLTQNTTDQDLFKIIIYPSIKGQKK